MEKRGRGATRPWHWLLALGLSLLSSGAMALGLGQIRVLSAPGQPLLAEIPIISNEPGELENARARLASPETFARVGLQPPSGLVSDLQFEITSDAQGRAVVRVTSTAPVDVPALGFLVEVDWGQGRLVREYSALVAAPQTAVAIEAPAIQAPAAMPSDAIIREPEPVAAAPEPAPAPVEATPPAPAPPARAVPNAPVAVPAAAPGEILARVERGQSLSQIAAGMDRGGRSLDDAMIALLRANPEAFIGGNIHRVRSGAVLRMPGEDDYAGAAAAALVREQTAQWRQLRAPVPQPAEAGPSLPAAGAAPAAVAAAPSGARLEIAPAAAASGTQATESGLGTGGEGDMLANEELRQAQEDLAARDSELVELRSRVEELEKMQKAQLQLIKLKDSELAAAQQTLAQANAASAQPSAGPAPGWWLGGLVLLLAAALVWWLARRPKPSPIPAARGTGFDAAALAAALPSAPATAPQASGAHEAPRDHADEPAYPAAPHPDDAAVPAWHTGPAGAAGATIGLAPLNPSPAGRERLELAIAYLDLGDVETARTLLHEVAAGPDPSARDEAGQLLREIG